MTYRNFIGKRILSGDKYAAENIPGIARKGERILGDCDSLEVAGYLHKRINGVDTKSIYLKQAK